MATLIPFPKFKGFDSNGNLLAGGQLFTYAAGTSTLLATYTDVGALTANANPVILDSNGEANVFVTPGASYKYVLKDSLGVTQWTQDNIGSNILVGPIPSSVVADIASIRLTTPTSGTAILLQAHTTAGDGGGGHFRGITGAAAGTYVDNNGTIIVPTGGDGSAAWIREGTDITPQMFGAVGDGVTSDTAAFASAMAVTSMLYVPNGTYLVNISMTSNRNIVGESISGTILKHDNPALPVIDFDSSLANITYCSVRSLTILNNSGIDGVHIHSDATNNTKWSDWLVFEDLYFRGGFSHAAINITGRSIWCTYTNVHATEAAIGLNVDSTGDVSENKFESCRFASNTQWGVRFIKDVGFNQNNLFIQCNIENNNTGNVNTNGGMYLSLVNSFNIQSCYFENNGTNALAAIYINTDAVARSVNIKDSIVQGSLQCIKSSGVNAARLMTGSIMNISKGVGDIISLNNDHPDNEVIISNIYPLAAGELKLYYGATSGVRSGQPAVGEGSMWYIPTVNGGTEPVIDLKNKISNVLLLCQASGAIYTIGALGFKNIPLGKTVNIMVKNWGAFSGSTVIITHNISYTQEPETSRLDPISLGTITSTAANVNMLANNRHAMSFTSNGANLVETGRSF